MAAIKRKKPAHEAALNENPKRLRPDHNTAARSATATATNKENEAPDRKTSKSTAGLLLAKEQPAFPRGGAGLLTPLEKKQISAEAKRDAAIEAKQGRDLFTSNAATASDESEVDEALKPAEATATKRSAKKTIPKGRKAQKQAALKESSVTIEGLSYKRLAIGTQIFGRVTAIGAIDLTISLPNNLTGYVPLTEVSSNFTSRLQRALAQVEDGSDEDSHGEEEVDKTSLKSCFMIGQFLRVMVSSLGSELSDKKGLKKRIELSINPTKTNAGLSRPFITPGVIIQASVASVEDHGLVMNLGLEKNDMTGFIPLDVFNRAAEISPAHEGAVILTHVTKVMSNGKIAQLSPILKSCPTLKNAPTVDAFLPGTLVDVLVSEISNEGLAGKIMGSIDATADIVHSGAFQGRETFMESFKIGQKLKGRIIFTSPSSETRKAGVSILPSLVDMDIPPAPQTNKDGFKLSSIVDSAEVIRVVSGLGIYLRLSPNRIGFAHISRLSDKKVDSVNETLGPYKVGSKHQVRIVDYSTLDGLCMVSLQQSIIEQPFLRIEDVPLGQVVKCTIEKVLIGQDGIVGLLVKIADGISGFVPPMHLSDIKLLNPEKKFREGVTLKARVLAPNGTKRQLRLTLKKTIVNSDQKIWHNLDDISVGDSSLGTLVKIEARGAVMQFFGNARGFLPVSEMSEAYIKDATQHFKIGQVLTVNAINVVPADRRLVVSCRERSASEETSLAAVKAGSIVKGVVFEKSQADLLLRLDDSNVIAQVIIEHISDGSERKRRSTMEKIRVGQRLEGLLVLQIHRKRRLVELSNKQSLIRASQKGEFIASFDELIENKVLTGYVSNITTNDGVFIRFADGITGLIPPRQVSPGSESLPNFGLELLQSVTTKVMSIDWKGATPRFWLTMQETIAKEQNPEVQVKPTEKSVNNIEVVNPADSSISSIEDFVVGKVTKARITSVKETQINVELAKDIHGRIDVSEVFDTWDDIPDRKRPLQHISTRQTLTVRILGAHDTRNHRFLPLTHRRGKHNVFELSIKPSVLKSQQLESLSLHDMKPGSSWIAYVNNVIEDFVMVNISPSVRGRIKAMDCSDDLSLAGDLQGNFPVGSALRVRVLNVDLDRGHLDLTARSNAASPVTNLESLSPGMILPGRVTRITERSLLVQLSDNVVGAVELIDMADDYALANPGNFQKNDVIRVAILRVDIPNKKVVLSLRPSKVLSTSMEVVDPEITSVQQLNVNDVIRGFVSNVVDKGLFVSLGHGVSAFVRVSNLSDAYLKAWKDHFQRDQLVKGKVVQVDEENGHVQLSLKESLMNANYKPPRTFANMEIGEIVTGKVAQVKDFGVFIVIDNSDNVRGLCHRSEIAEKRIEDASKLFSEGDQVKAKVLKLDLPNRRINFGMKASYFEDPDQVPDDVESDDLDTDTDNDEGMGADVHDESEASDDAQEFVESESDSETGENEEDGNSLVSGSASRRPAGLSVSGFDWYGIPTTNPPPKRSTDLLGVEDSQEKQKKRKKRAEIQIDKTGDLDANGPQSTDDFERLLLGEPDTSMLWLQYMAFHLELGDTDQARQIGERALRTIGLGQDTEKLNIWIALLNLENAYGDDESIESAFKRACEYNDSQEIASRLISIYIQSGKHGKADDLFQETLKKSTQDSKIYINYAKFCLDTIKDADKGRALLPRALQILPPFTHFDITSKFAQLEFKSSAGLPERGRTIFEGLINSFPKRVDLFNVMLDMEMQHGGLKDSSDESGGKDQVRSLFRRIFERKLKPKQAKHFFKRWLTFEEEHGDERRVEEVKAKAATWVKNSAET